MLEWAEGSWKDWPHRRESCKVAHSKAVQKAGEDPNRMQAEGLKVANGVDLKTARMASIAAPSRMREQGLEVANTVGLEVAPEVEFEAPNHIRDQGLKIANGAALGVAQKTKFLVQHQKDKCCLMVLIDLAHDFLPESLGLHLSHQWSCRALEPKENPGIPTL